MVLVSLLGSFAALGCVQVTVDVPEMCDSSEIAFVLPAEIAAALPAGTELPDTTVTASTLLDFEALRDSNWTLTPSASGTSLQFPPGQLGKIQEIVATIASGAGSVEVLRVRPPAGGDPNAMLDVTSALDQGVLMRAVQAGPTMLTYSISGQIPVAGTKVQSRTCFAASMKAKKSVL